MTILRILTPILFLLAIGHQAGAQTLFTYGKKPVTKQEFLKAYNKNNTGEKPTEKSYREYLELYTNFKLKVQAAMDLKLDTLYNQKAELQSFRGQIVEGYMKDEAAIELLLDEAIERSKTDVQIAHIFLPLKADASEAEINKTELRIREAFQELGKKSFEEVAIKYSQDPSVKVNKGELGFITCFVLPYELETIAYSTPEGKYSKPFQSKIGFHIFKILGKRKAVGTIRASQILFAFPPDITENQKQAIKQKADSIYRVLKTGDDFKVIAAKLSDDNLTFQAGGEIPEFGVGRYHPAFESAAFSLSKDGDISLPVMTDYGYHIIKRLQRKQLNENNNSIQYRAEVKQKVMQSDRMEVARQLLLRKIQEIIKFRKYPVKEKSISVFTDSVLHGKNPPMLPELNEKTALFSLDKKTITGGDYLRYLKAIVGSGNIPSNKRSLQFFNDFMQNVSLEYYREHLEEYNKDFAYQLKEFGEGNLLFEVMQHKVWDVASADTAGLKKYFTENKSKYWWEPSADAILITASTEKAVDETKNKLQADYSNWKKIIEASNGILMGDSGRFELSQIPVVDRTNFVEGLVTAPVKHETDNSVTFAYIIKLYRNREPRDFQNARGLVINDYQAFVEENWIKELKKKYPVKVNEKVFNSLPK